VQRRIEELLPTRLDWTLDEHSEYLALVDEEEALLQADRVQDAPG
jgi:hypothetical protein